MEVSGLRTTESTIIRDHPCWNCGYNLRGVSQVSCCPECGEAIDLTKRPRVRGWRKVVQGFIVFLACLVIVFLAAATLFLDNWAAVASDLRYVSIVGGVAAVVAFPVWWWTRNRVLAITFASFVLMLLILQFVSLTWTPAQPYVSFFKNVRNGMTQQQVLDRLDTYFPNRESEGRPSISRLDALGLVMVLDPNDGRYNSSVIVVEFEDDRVVSKEYLPD